MHPCLLVTEILEAIFQMVDADNEPGSRDIMSLVKTCRAFHEPALDLLWRNIPNVIPLLMAMPADLWQIVTQRHDHYGILKVSTLLEFKREATTDDWEVFDRYSYRVRIMGVTPVHPSIYKRLSDHGIPIIPNLSALAPHDGLAYLSPFLTSSLTRISLSVSSSNVDDLSQLLIELPSRSPNIQKLYIYADIGLIHIGDQVSECVSQLICKLSHIEELYCKTVHISIAAFHHLSRLCSVRNLEINADFLDYVQLPNRGRPPPLVQISLYSAWHFNVDAYTMFINLLAPSTLEIIDINTILHIYSDDLQLLINSLVNHYRRDKDISLTIFHYGSQCPKDDIATFSMIIPLLSFSNFTKLSLCANLVDLSNSELLQIAKAMPKLQTLMLQCQCDLIRTAKLTLDGLLHIASFCHEIEELSILIHGIFDWMVPQEDINMATNRSLATLNVGHSTLSLPAEKVAAFLLALFPI